MPPEEVLECRHVAAWKCGTCDKIHIAHFGVDRSVVGQVNIDPDDLNALIVQLMALRGGESA